jgi:VWFA-related protein
VTRPKTAVLLLALALVAGLFASALLAQDPQRRRGFAIEIVQPVTGEIVFGKTKLVAKVTIDNPDLVEKVEFVIGDEVVFVDREPPYECFHDFGEEQRSWIVRAVAHHVEGVTVSDASITRRLKFSTIERVNRVILWVTATDKAGNLITDLQRDDFVILENDDEQKIIDFYHEDRPITMAILIDTSGSMQEKIKEVHSAAGAFVETLREEDRSLIIDFDDKVFLIQDLTPNHAALKEAIESTEPLGATAIYDALHAAYRKIGQIDGRKVVVLLSDGEDTASQFGFNRVLEEARTNNTMIFTIGLGIDGGTPRKNVLKEFSDSTGGRYFYVNKAGELGDTYERIAEELRTQYYLTYSTTNETWDGHWIKIKVQSKRPGVKIRARKGYFAVRKGGATG